MATILSLRGFRSSVLSVGVVFWEFVPHSPLRLGSSRDLVLPSVLFFFLSRRGTVPGGYGETRLWTISSGILSSAFRSLVRVSRLHVDKSSTSLCILIL